MLFYAVDLGTTNIKVAVYDETLQRLLLRSHGVVYRESGRTVEFDPDAYFNHVLTLIRECTDAALAHAGKQHAVIVLTGQAESFVLVDASGGVVRPGISWMDMRSEQQCAEISGVFGEMEGFRITGQPWVTPTWPASKLRWLWQNEPQALQAASTALMIKDFILMRLTGKKCGELSTRAFTYFFDLSRKDYWDDMLAFCGVHRGMLPELVQPGVDAGPVLSEVAAHLPDGGGFSVNVGALDHFAAMVGAGAYRQGVISESAGTVLSVSMLTDAWKYDPERLISCHCGLRIGEYVLFNGCDSGGVCMEWFK